MAIKMVGRDLQTSNSALHEAEKDGYGAVRLFRRFPKRASVKGSEEGKRKSSGEWRRGLLSITDAPASSATHSPFPSEGPH